MAFSDYKSLAQVQEEFQIRYQEADFVDQLWIELPALFCLEFDFNLTTMDAFSSEAARCELVIFPVLREIYRKTAVKPCAFRLGISGVRVDDSA
jgi:hypothetical protein